MGNKSIHKEYTKDCWARGYNNTLHKDLNMLTTLLVRFNNSLLSQTLKYNLVRFVTLDALQVSPHLIGF
jgi:hypothetical protein